jgi:hypothetical protein
MKAICHTWSVVMLAVMLVGCATGPNGQATVDVQRVARLAGVAAEVGATVYLQKHPGDRAYFQIAASALAALDASSDYDPAKFAAALQTLPIRELRGPEGSLYVGLAIVAWEELSAEAARLDKTVWVKPVLERVQLGLERALVATAP